MVTTLSLQRLKHVESVGWLKGANYDPLDYMLALESAGFEDVGIEYHDKNKGLSYEVRNEFRTSIHALFSAGNQSDETARESDVR